MDNHRLMYFPITLFGAVMGFSGLAIAMMNAQKLAGSPAWATDVFVILAGISLLVVSATYFWKTLKATPAVVKEFNHPIASNFFAAFSISLMLISFVFKDVTPFAASTLWYLGAFLQIAITLILLNNWIHQEGWQIHEMSPAWFIPIVGNIIAPIGALEFADRETAWFFFSIGLVFWLILQVIVMYRLFFHPPMPKILEPFLFIFIAPPAMGFISYVALNYGEVDEFARILFYTAIFFTLLLTVQIKRFLSVPFALTWWAYTFPVSAMANASWVMHQTLNYDFFAYLAQILMVFLVFIIGLLTWKTLVLVKNKKLCVPPPQPPVNQDK